MHPGDLLEGGLIFIFWLGICTFFPYISVLTKSQMLGMAYLTSMFQTLLNRNACMSMFQSKQSLNLAIVRARKYSVQLLGNRSPCDMHAVRTCVVLALVIFQYYDSIYIARNSAQPHSGLYRYEWVPRIFASVSCVLLRLAESPRSRESSRDSYTPEPLVRALASRK